MTAASLRKGWCPGARRPMLTGDGLLVRLRLTGGVVPAPLARAVADCARRFGNGALDLSARANLQLRGVSDARFGPLTERLEALSVLDQDMDGEAVRNVVSSPLAGLDPSALVDVRPVVEALERHLAGDAALHALPAKFGFLVDDGGRFGPSDVAADVRFEARPGPNGPVFAVGLGGDRRGAVMLGACAPGAAPDVAAALARTFIALRRTGTDLPRRMAAMLAVTGAEPFRAAAEVSETPDAPVPERRPAQPLGYADLGGGMGAIGFGAPFGRWAADDLDRLAGMAERYGPGELRLTPWRAIMVPVRHERLEAEPGGAQPAVARLLRSSGFIVDPSDPRLAAAACPGAPDCASATTATRRDAALLAQAARGLAPSGVTLHVSGCPKGCARPDATNVALVGRNGLYDLIRHGRADGDPVRRGLTASEARDLIEQMGHSVE
ncbi:precorrin-3B synthase [Alsobacter sp. KACC 23698]|uniref:Precorrin-3B synthase n=1 Tax=Alsobacter sp. KACC 23698 TaxID=3149229 RepID=A0AAU7JH46_9HYPH